VAEQQQLGLFDHPLAPLPAQTCWPLRVELDDAWWPGTPLVRLTLTTPGRETLVSAALAEAIATRLLELARQARERDDGSR
jgi:hypothetical protein